jgi:hypothetical protein
VGGQKLPPEASRAILAFLQAASLVGRWVGAPLADEDPPAAVLHLRLGVGEQPVDFATALKRARALKAPLISDDRGRFGQGAVVTLVARHALVGRATAETALRLQTDPTTRLLPHAVPGIEVWIDLAAADAQGLKVPLPFIARADHLKRGAPLRRSPAKRAAR